MPAKSKKEPSLLPYVLKAIGKGKDERGVTAPRVIKYVETQLKKSDIKFKQRKLADHVEKALQHGVSVKLLKLKPGRYLLEPENTSNMSFKESDKDVQSAKVSASAIPSSASSISAVDSNGSIVEKPRKKQNQPRQRSSSRRRKIQKRKSKANTRGESTPKSDPADKINSYL